MWNLQCMSSKQSIEHGIVWPYAIVSSRPACETPTIEYQTCDTCQLINAYMPNGIPYMAPSKAMHHIPPFCHPACRITDATAGTADHNKYIEAWESRRCIQPEIRLNSQRHMYDIVTHIAFIGKQGLPMSNCSPYGDQRSNMERISPVLLNG